MARFSPFHRLLFATGISSLGDGVRFIAMPLLATRLTSDPRLIAAVFVADRLPWLLFLLPGGALADRFDRLRMRVLVDGFRAALGAVFVVLVTTGHVNLAMVYAVTVLMSSAEAIVDSSSMALVPALAEPDHLEHAVGQLQATELVTRDLIGPALGGVLFTIGLAVPLAVDSLSFALSALVALTIRGTFRVTVAAPASQGVRSAVTDMRHSIGAGLAWLWREPTLRSLACLSTFLCMVASAFVAVLVVFATDDLGLGPRGYGLLMIPSAIGGLLGAWLAPRMRHFPLGRVLGISTVVTGIADLLISQATALAVVAVLLVVDTAGVLVWNVLTIAFRQRTIPDELLGRVSSAYRFLLSLGAPFGALLGGVLAASVGARTTIALAGVMACVGGIVVAAVLGRARAGVATVTVAEVVAVAPVAV